MAVSARRPPPGRLALPPIGLLEQHQIVRASRRGERDDVEVDRLPAARRPDPQTGLPHRGLALARRVQCRAQAVEQSLTRHLQQIQAGFAGCRLEVRAGLAPELDDLQVGIDDDARRGVAIEDDAADFALQRLLRLRDFLRQPLRRHARRRVVDADGHRRSARRRLLAIDAEFLVGQAEQPDLRADGLGLSQHEESLWVERVMEDRDEPLLQHDVHVDQDVAAENQVETREGRILGQVLPREDAQIAHGLADAVAAIDLREEAAQDLRRDVRLDARRIESGAGVFDRRCR